MINSILSSLDPKHPLMATIKQFQLMIKDNKVFNNIGLATIAEKLILEKPSVDFDSYLQGVSEIMFYIYFAQTGINFKHDVKLKTRELDSNNKRKNVDLQAVHNGYVYNIEIKTPEQEVYNTEAIYGKHAYRSVMSKEDADQSLNELTSLIAEGINNLGQVTDVIKLKMNDNKLKDYLSSAQIKFSIIVNTNELNILCLCVPIDKLTEYWRYMFNGYSGLLTQYSFNKEFEIFDNIDAVVLSSSPTLHIMPLTGYNSWDMNNVANVIFLNPIGKKYSYLTSSEAVPIMKTAFDLIPNITKEWDKEYMFYEKHKSDDNALPIPNFEKALQENFPDIWRNLYNTKSE